MEMTVSEFDKMLRDRAPSSDSLFVNSVNGSEIGRNVPIWFGWHAAEMAYISSRRAQQEIIEVPDVPIGCVGQWVCFWGPTDTEIITLSVNLPDMTCEKLGDNPRFSIGRERVYADTPVEKLEFLLEEGYKKLLAMMDEERKLLAE